MEVKQVEESQVSVPHPIFYLKINTEENNLLGGIKYIVQM